MELRTLERHIASLAAMPETRAQVISCYLNLQSGLSGCQNAWEEQVAALRKALTGAQLRDFEEALVPIERFRESAAQQPMSVAMFARAGEQPFFLALRFRVPLPTRIEVGSAPNIYHLVEIKDNYNRYVVLLATEERAHILAVNLGSVTQEVWRTRPELRRRVGHEWTTEHLRSHRRERIHQFIHDQIRTVDRLMSAGGYGHLILAGGARVTACIRKALPKHLAAKLVDVVPAGPNSRTEDVVAGTLRSFLDHEELESVSLVDELLGRMHTNGLAVAGTPASLRALKSRQANVLVLARDYQAGQGWDCLRCGAGDLALACPASCPKCGASRLRGFDVKEEMVRLAERSACHVEVVLHSDALARLGGVGCLLRFAASFKAA
jgi:hypothetical protein